MCLATVTLAMAQQAKPKTDGPSIKFEKTTHDFGTFSETKSTQKCVFTFTNVGKSPLIINQAIGSCHYYFFSLVAESCAASVISPSI